ncbi:DUF58 domain-containing protein [Aliikangiella sp. G2MR2-5]|uniref:DUF58 domain-containing protein n=1 Tax=Aliikangiella sp. G2MR2-5 TaxID=2788943 RepID=UPI0018A91566|nr:DUF58 domain-containing protein [Aliikangiella sp. G2MR2-5]
MITQIRLKAYKWFGKRMPCGDIVEFNQRSTYIWPAASGYFLIFIILLMMVGATNYQNNLAFLLTFLIVGIGLATIIFTFKNLQGIQFALRGHGELFCEEFAEVEISLTSLTGTKHSAIGIGWSLEELVWTDVEPDEPSLVRLSFKAKRRGQVPLERILVTSYFPFGWLRTWSFFGFSSTVLVYPKPVEPPPVFESVGNQEEEQGHKKRGSEDFFGLKSYEIGEPLSRIDWKSFAREKGLYVREFAVFQGTQLCFDWDDYAGTDDELRLSYLTFLVIQAAQQQIGYSLKLPGEYIMFDEGEAHRNNCLKVLALYDTQSKEARERSLQ